MLEKTTSEKPAPVGQEANIFSSGEITPRLIRAVVDRIAQSFNPEKIILFGSYAREDASKNSDLDIFVVMESDEPKAERSGRIRNLFWPRDFDLDVIVYTPKEFKEAADHEDYWFNPLVKDVITQGRVLYERQPV